MEFILLKFLYFLLKCFLCFYVYTKGGYVYVQFSSIATYLFSKLKSFMETRFLSLVKNIGNSYRVTRKVFNSTQIPLLQLFSIFKEVKSD